MVTRILSESMMNQPLRLLELEGLLAWSSQLLMGHLGTQVRVRRHQLFYLPASSSISSKWTLR